MSNTARELAETLVELGVKYVFGVPSGNWISFGEGIQQTKGIEFILVSNEASAGFMADVTWRLTGTLAACFGTYGPGACNLTTGVCGGFLDRSPMLVFADEVAENLLNHIVQMHIDQPTLFKPITKAQFRLSSKAVKGTIYEAHARACEEVPGPVYIGLPTGIGSQEHLREKISFPRIRPLPEPQPAVLHKMAELFLQARKPVIVCGLTAIRRHCGPLIQKLAERFGLPVILTPMAKGLIGEDHNWYAGVLAHALSNRVAQIYRQADMVISIGYDPVEINYEDWLPDIPLMHIDTREADSAYAFKHPVVNVIGDVGLAIQSLLNLHESKKQWQQKKIEQHKSRLFHSLKGEQNKFDPRAVLTGLRQVLPETGIMTCDVGAHLHLIGQAWKTYGPDCQLMTNGCSSMGFAIPAAIAAKLCQPHREVVCITGDGGFLMMAGELATITRLALKIIIIILADRELSLIRIKQGRAGFNCYGTRLYNQDLDLHDSFLGLPIISVDSQTTYSQALSQAFAFPKATIINISIPSPGYDRFILQ